MRMSQVSLAIRFANCASNSNEFQLLVKSSRSVYGSQTCRVFSFKDSQSRSATIPPALNASEDRSYASVHNFRKCPISRRQCASVSSREYPIFRIRHKLLAFPHRLIIDGLRKDAQKLKILLLLDRGGIEMVRTQSH